MTADTEMVEQEKLVTMIDFFETTDDEIDTFDEEAWAKGEGYKIPGYPQMEEKLEGLESGLYLFAGESNGGKSALMMNLLYNIATCDDNNLFGIYFTLDDSRREVIPRIVAMEQQIPIGVVSKPQRFKNKIDNGEEGASVYQTFLDKRSVGMQNLKDVKDKFKIVDPNSEATKNLKYAEGIREYIQNVLIYLKANAPEKKIIVAIDALNDIRFKYKKISSTPELNSEIARFAKDLSVEFDIPVFGSTHLRKLNINRRPTLDDLKESTEYVYEASVVMLVHNDVSKNKEAANVYYNQKDVEGKRPVVETDWAKNKKSSFKGRTYNLFVPECSLLQEADKDTMKRFDTLVYEG